MLESSEVSMIKVESKSKTLISFSLPAGLKETTYSKEVNHTSQAVYAVLGVVADRIHEARSQLSSMDQNTDLGAIFQNEFELLKLLGLDAVFCRLVLRYAVYKELEKRSWW
jgi:hypothetical protein